MLPILTCKGHLRGRVQNNTGPTYSHRPPIGQSHSWRRHVCRVVTDWLLPGAALQP